MSLAQQMIVISPQEGAAPLSAEQRNLLVGKARWLRAVFEANLPTIPTIAITRRAWNALLDESEENSGDKLRTAWVATLSRLVAKGKKPPQLVVRTSASQHMRGLMAAKLDIPPPSTEKESVDLSKPLARAVTDAFASYATISPVWGRPADQNVQDDEIVIVQAVAEHQTVQFVTRDATTGLLEPRAVEGGSIPQELDPQILELSRVIDEATGVHTLVFAELTPKGPVFLSARRSSVSAEAELAAAVDRAETGTWSIHQAVQAVQPKGLTQLLHPRLDEKDAQDPIAVGLGVSHGAAAGRVVFSAEDAARAHARGQKCILVMMETGPSDIEGMNAASGILTARGGVTSHAAVIARVVGRPCVAGVRKLQIDEREQTCEIGGIKVRAGENITIDGTDGTVFLDALPLSQPPVSEQITRLLDWSDGARTISVRTNVETRPGAEIALKFGAEGIGLARSEHMFFSHERMVALRRLILSESAQARAQALEGLIAYQTDDYADLFAMMQSKPVCVRLFDPPLHEFLPRTEEDLDETAKSLGLTNHALLQKIVRLDEVNPMLGHRGCRLAITFPEILDMQIRALISGVRDAYARTQMTVNLEIMVPFVASAREVVWIKSQVAKIFESEGRDVEHAVSVKFGTMIELPRAALRAAEIAREVDFISFGTNDLTQTTFGISRDDSPAFLAAYKRHGLFEHDPFVTLDERGVGELIKTAIEQARSANLTIDVGICGEHAGDPASIAFFAKLNVDYISCSPYQVPVARLATAQAQIQ